MMFWFQKKCGENCGVCYTFQMKKIYVTGIAGTGKSTIAHELRKRGVDVIDVDNVPNLCAWKHIETGKKVHRANPDNDFIDTHDYICDTEMLEELMNQSNDLVVVFGCVGDNSALLPLFNTTFLLQCSPTTLVERLKTRSTNDFGKDPEVQERMLAWRIIFDDLMCKAGATPIDTDAPLEIVLEEIIHKINK